ncbi:MAG: hypothetical protein K2Z81_15120, partial [Cyanobacteria bacterium]|nr:hypothetical protein [Cyanobacteriota bacterium]
LHERMGSLLRRLGNSEQSKAEFQEALGIKISTGAVVAAYTPHPYWQNIQYGFYDGAPNCMRRFDQGAEQQMITANGVTVGAALRPQPVESTKTTQVDVIVRNDSGQQIQFLPTPPQLILTTPKFEFVPQVDPVKLAATVAKKGERKASWIRFWGENATTSLTSTYIGNGGGPFWGGGGWGGGGWGGGWGGGGFPYFSRSGNMSTMIQQVPNYAAQARALQRAADVSDNAQRNASSIQRSGLGPTSLPEGQSISGSFYFDTNKVQKAAFRVPIGNAVFCFEFPSTK